MIKRWSLVAFCVLFILSFHILNGPSQVLASGSVKSLENFAGEWVTAKGALIEEPYLALYGDELKPRIMKYLNKNLFFWKKVQGQWKLLHVNKSVIDESGLGELNFTYQGSRLDGGDRIKWEVTRTFFLRVIDGRWKIVGWGDRTERMLY